MNKKLQVEQAKGRVIIITSVIALIGIAIPVFYSTADSQRSVSFEGNNNHYIETQTNITSGPVVTKSDTVTKTSMQTSYQAVSIEQPQTFRIIIPVETTTITLPVRRDTVVHRRYLKRGDTLFLIKPKVDSAVHGDISQQGDIIKNGNVE